MSYPIKKITIEDALFPSSLKNIKTPPQELYYCGKILPTENCLAIVGARLCSKYGQECSLEIGSALSMAGLTIVAGLARGIDYYAHLSALKNKKRTIAVLGTAIDNIYPKENLKLAQEILKNEGLIISEYAPGTITAKYCFVERNRLIAGLSLGVLVIEAREKSGSLITANYAKEQNKKIFAVPNNIHSPLSRGCHNLIKNGANLIENANDVLGLLGFNNLPNSPKNGKPYADCNPEEIKILEILSENPLNIEAIIRTTGWPANKITSLLSILEIKNKIIDLGDKTYCLVRN